MSENAVPVAITTDEQAREAMLANGYKLRTRGEGRDMRVEATETNRRSGKRTWTGINCLDLVQAFKLDQRKAGE